MVWVMSPSHAGAFYIRLHGMVTEHFTGEAMKGVQVRLVKDSIHRETIITPGNGRYELFLERGYNYQVWFHRADLLTKHVVIDAREVPLFPDVPFYDMDLQMSLFTWVDGLDLSLFDSPVAMATYKRSVRNMSWDVAYTSAMQPKLERLMVHYEREVALRERRTVVSGSSSRRRNRKRVDF